MARDTRTIMEAILCPIQFKLDQEIDMVVVTLLATSLTGSSTTY